MKDQEALWMHRALDLARKGETRTTPNPMVGCVIVRDGRVVGEGYHRAFGGPHAEVHALERAGRSARGSTMVVTLEPCIHHGKTPPCVDAILRAGVARVIVASRDPNPAVNGRGLRALRKAGVEVLVGPKTAEAARVNERFFWWHRTGQAYVGIKWAQTLDGFVADMRGGSRWISGPDARAYAHRLRSMYEAILVGSGTVLRDDPKLTVRHIRGRNPVRVVVATRLAFTGREHVFSGREARTILITNRSHVRNAPLAVRRLLRNGVEVIGLSGKGPFAAKRIVDVLSGEGITSVLIEGGPRTLGPFLEEGIVNAYHLFMRRSLLAGGTPATAGLTARTVGRIVELPGTDLRTFPDGTVLLEGRIRR